MEFKDLIKKVKETKVLASADPGSDPRTYTAKVGKIRRAKEDLAQLFGDYKTEVRRRVIFILPEGAGSEKFAALADKEFGCFVVDAEGVFKDSIANVNPVLFTNSPFNPSLLDTVTNYFQDVADEIGLMSYPMVIYKNTYARTLRNQEDLLTVTKEAFTENIGSEVVGHYAIHKVAIEALGDKFAGKMVPVILLTSDDKLRESLSETLKVITNNVFTIDTKEEDTDKEVEAALVKVKKQSKNVV